ncbi:MAG: ABC transporter ATP-binding protein [Lachnospiraceae bacterium]|nr:ABC transporter ATP-binding protein [Lachnospiraceae bacterium]
MGSSLLTIATIICSFCAAAGQSTQFAKIFDEKEEDIARGSEMPDMAEDICIENADFSYDGNKKVLEGVSCTIKEGKVNAIIGTNGSGKSTLVKLIDRLYTAADGNMTLGGQKASEISLKAWRSKFGIVSQNASLFSGTIRSNILYGMEREVSEDELWQVIRITGIEDILAAHEDGLDFDVGINGSHLSGGEQQRIAIARAMIKNPDYLILDEATANLDTKTAKKIEAGIDAIMKGRTVISIAHSFDAIKKADNIIVLDKGEVIGSGSHNELLDTCDFYAKLYRAGFEM